MGKEQLQELRRKSTNNQSRRHGSTGKNAGSPERRKNTWRNYVYKADDKDKIRLEDIKGHSGVEQEYKAIMEGKQERIIKTYYDKMDNDMRNKQMLLQQGQIRYQHKESKVHKSEEEVEDQDQDFAFNQQMTAYEHYLELKGKIMKIFQSQ